MCTIHFYYVTIVFFYGIMLSTMGWIWINDLMSVTRLLYLLMTHYVKMGFNEFLNQNVKFWRMKWVKWLEMLHSFYTHFRKKERKRRKKIFLNDWINFRNRNSLHLSHVFDEESSPGWCCCLPLSAFQKDLATYEMIRKSLFRYANIQNVFAKQSSCDDTNLTLKSYCSSEPFGNLAHDTPNHLAT